MSSPHNSVIVALATPRGVGAISVVRASGYDLISMFEGLIVPFGTRPWCAGASRRVRLIDERGVFDDAIAVYCSSPDSYTGEDTLEISTHGNPLIVDRLLMSMVHRGASIAGPGEFTKRALLNGKIDVVGAEGVLAVSEAVTDRGLELAREGIDGQLRDWYSDLRSRLLEIAAELEARLDYPADELALRDDKDLVLEMGEIAGEANAAAETYKIGDLLLRGATVALIGAPNAGKSSLFNALLGRERAVVHATAGTTRDVVEASSMVGDLRVSWLDTAGERETDDPVESAGIEMSQQMVATADLLVVVVRAGQVGLSHKEREVLSRARRRDHLIVLNGVDVPGGYASIEGAIETTATTGQGVEALKAAVVQSLTKNSKYGDGVILASERQRTALERLASYLRTAAAEMPVAGIAVAAFSVGQAIYELDQLTGLDGDSDMLKTLFSKFCIGK